MQNNYKNKESKMDFCNENKKKTLRLAFFSMLSLILLITSGCSSGDDDAFVLTHQGQFLDAPVRGLDYICGGQSGTTDKDGMFTFERGKEITFRLGNIQIGETVPVVSGVTMGEILPDVWVFTPRMLIPNAKNRDPVVANLLRFLQTLDNDYNFSDGIDNASNGIYLSDTVIKNAANFKGTLNFNLSEAEFQKAAETVISTLTGEYRPLIPKLAAQHHFILQLINNQIDNALNNYESPGVTMSVETPCPCDPKDTECIESGVVDGVVSYDKASHAYIWDFAAGYSDLENKRPMTVDTRFRICSLTKSFVAMTILKLVENGKIKSYNDPVVDYLPASIKDTFKEFAAGNTITIAQVMNHSAGIPNFYRIPSPGNVQEGDGEWFLNLLFHPEMQWSLDKRIELVTTELNKGLEYPPGQGWGYSNTAYTLLGLMLENITGKSWEQAIRDEIIEPYGLTDTIIPEIGKASITDSISKINYYSPYDPMPTDDYAYGYLSLAGVTEGMYGKDVVGLTKRDIQEPSFLNSAGSIIGTAPDLRSWIKLIANTGNEDGMFGATFDWLHDTSKYNELFFTLNGSLKVGANVYHNVTDKKYIISGNSTGYDVNATYDIENKVAVGACANRTFGAPEGSDEIPDIWKFQGSHTVQIKDVIVFKTLDIFTK
ncbi:MAG: beta-lactamase family protein [Desulfamplus sp.]|nr:beta-lactamase family protein [Desulfamplus sp.]